MTEINLIKMKTVTAAANDIIHIAMDWKTGINISTDAEILVSDNAEFADGEYMKIGAGDAVCGIRIYDTNGNVFVKAVTDGDICIVRGD